MVTDEVSREKSIEILNRIKEKSEDDFEKQLIFIASGALGVSFAFLEKLVNLTVSVHVWTLTLSWICLALALCVNLVSHYISKNLLEQSTDEYNKYCDGEVEYSILVSHINQRNSSINRVNYFSIAALFVGLVSLITFVTINIDHMSKDRSETKTQSPGEQKGRTIPVPQPQSNPADQRPYIQPSQPEGPNKPSKK